MRRHNSYMSAINHSHNTGKLSYLHELCLFLLHFTLGVRESHELADYFWSPSGEGTINVPRSDCLSVKDPKCLDTPLNFFFINFCNIRSQRSNFQSVEHHLSSSKPHLLFLTETQVSEATDSSSFSVPSYFLYPHFQFKAGCCVYVRNDLTCSRAHALESSEFSTIWLRLQSHSHTKFICAVYLSPNSSDYKKFFNYLTSKVEHILTLFPFAEISILGDFNVHHQLWLSSPFTDHPGELAYNFAILHDLEQLVQHPTRIPDCLGDTPNILDLFPQPQPQPQPFHPSLSQCILASPSPSQPLSVHSSLSQSIPASPSPSQPLSVHSSLSQSIPASPSPSQPLPVHPRLSQSIPASPSPSQPLPVHFSLSQSIPASLSAFQPLPVHPSLSQCILASPSPSQPLSVHSSLSQSIPASPSPSQPLSVHSSLSQSIPASPSDNKAIWI
ncbi:uncharacterized protein LOC135116266 [Scylla paramamosain]|uniref:uncharacterized protein LOC135116266 n=1 Tax=Scylla paramamosain TaxID=85552 RepID=UPI003083A9E9